MKHKISISVPKKLNMFQTALFQAVTFGIFGAIWLYSRNQDIIEDKESGSVFHFIYILSRLLFGLILAQFLFLSVRYSPHFYLYRIYAPRPLVINIAFFTTIILKMNLNFGFLSVLEKKYPDKKFSAIQTLLFPVFYFQRLINKSEIHL